jgi:hypothetical protein
MLTMVRKLTMNYKGTFIFNGPKPLVITSILFVLGTLSAGPAFADVVVPSGALFGPSPASPGNGLNGQYYFIGQRSTTVSDTTLAAVQAAAPATPTSLFLATSLSYGTPDTPGDTDSVETFLNWNGGANNGTDGLSLIPDPNAGSTGIYTSYFNIFGYINITNVVGGLGKVSFTLSTDDGSKLIIGGATVIDNDGVHTTSSVTVTADFSANGLYPIDIQYFNQAMANNGGGAQLLFTDDQPGTLQDQLYATPEPASALMFGLGVLVLGFIGRKSRFCK